MLSEDSLCGLQLFCDMYHFNHTESSNWMSFVGYLFLDSSSYYCQFRILKPAYSVLFLLFLNVRAAQMSHWSLQIYIYTVPWDHFISTDQTFFSLSVIHSASITSVGLWRCCRDFSIWKSHSAVVSMSVLPEAAAKRVIFRRSMKSSRQACQARHGTTLIYLWRFDTYLKSSFENTARVYLPPPQ